MNWKLELSKYYALSYLWDCFSEIDFIQGMDSAILRQTQNAEINKI